MPSLHDIIMTDLLNISTDEFKKIRQSTLKNIIISEVIFISNAINDCLKYIEKKCLIKPSEFNHGRMHRGALLNDLDQKTLEPMGRAFATKCGEKDKNEALWFSKELMPNYIKERLKELTTEPKYGITICKHFNDSFEIENKVIMNLKFINLTCNKKIKCDGENIPLIRKTLQKHFNKCLFIPLLRNYSTKYSYFTREHNLKPILDKKNKLMEDLTKEGLINKGVPGYPCGRDGTITSLDYIFTAWNYKDGTRDSVFKEDRLHVTVLFKIIAIFNEIIHYTWVKSGRKNNEFNTILGWVCDDAPASNHKKECRIFPAEFAIAIKYLQDPYRDSIFKPDVASCSLAVYQLVNDKFKKILIELPLKNGGRNPEALLSLHPTVGITSGLERLKSMPKTLPKTSLTKTSLTKTLPKTLPKTVTKPVFPITYRIDDSISSFQPFETTPNSLPISEADDIEDDEYIVIDSAEAAEDVYIPENKSIVTKDVTSQSDSKLNIEKIKELEDINEYLFHLTDVIEQLKAEIEVGGGTGHRIRRTTRKRRTSRKRHITRKKHRK